jgi:hypothetical protein
MSSEDGIELNIDKNNLGSLVMLDEVIAKSIHVAMERVGQKLKAASQGHIQNQDLGWDALNESYLKWKIKEGYSNNIYIMTSSYIQAITYQYSPTYYTLFVGVLRTSTHPLTGDSIANIAEILEYGSVSGDRVIPPRPLWTPTLEENKRSIETTIGVWVKKGLDAFAALHPDKGTPNES